MIFNIRSSILCSLALFVAHTNADYEKRQESSDQSPQSQPFTSTLPPETATNCCSGTVTCETTIAKAGPTYIEGTTITHQIDYFTYWIQDNTTISSVTSSALNSSFVTNPVPHTVPSTANPDPGVRTLNTLAQPCCTITVTRTLTYDPVKQTAVYYRDRVETAFTVHTTTSTTTEVIIPSQDPVVQINDGQVQNAPASAQPSADQQSQAAPAGNDSASAQSPPAAVASAPVDRVSKFALGIFIGGAIVALL